MGDEPDDLVLRLLREVRAKLNDFDDLKSQLARMDERFDDLHEIVYTATGFATHGHVRSEATEKRLKKREDRLDKLEEKA